MEAAKRAGQLCPMTMAVLLVASSGMHAGVLRPTFGIRAAALGVDGRLAGILPAGVRESEREP